MGLIICVVAHAANVHDSKGAKEVFDCLYELRFDEDKLEENISRWWIPRNHCRVLKRENEHTIRSC